MSFSNQTVKNVYVANGSVDTFSISFTFASNDQALVYLVDVSDPLMPVSTLQVEGSDYDFTGDPGTEVVFDTPPDADLMVVIVRKTALVQALDLINSGEFLAEDFEKGIDLIVMMIQELYNRAILLPAEYPAATFGALPEPIAGTLIGFNSDATGFDTYTIPGSTLYPSNLEVLSPDLGSGDVIAVDQEATSQLIHMKSTGGDVTVTLESGSAFTVEVILVGDSDTDSVTLVDGGNVAINGSVTLHANETLTLRWDKTNSKYLEIGRKV